MIAKYALRVMRQQRIPFYKFSEQQGNRTLEADDANPNLENQEKAFSYFRLAQRVIWWTFSGLFAYNLYLNIYKEKPEQEIGYVKYVNMAARYFQDEYQKFYDFMTKPPIDKLLPDIPKLPFGYELPKTVVLNLSGTLIHADYVFGKGTDIKRRQGLQQFLRKLSTLYEVVILTDDDTMFTQTVCEKLDPTHQMLAGRFGRESHVLEKNKYIKDLKYLNRPISRIVVVESNPERLINYQENGIFIDKFDGTKQDEVLNQTLALLEHLAKPQVKDIRKELNKYGNFNPQVKYMEELKAREIQIKDNLKGGFMGSLMQKKSAHFDKRY